jgi:hypothetical protein
MSCRHRQGGVVGVGGRDLRGQPGEDGTHNHRRRFVECGKIDGRHGTAVLGAVEALSSSLVVDDMVSPPPPALSSLVVSRRRRHGLTTTACPLVSHRLSLSTTRSHHHHLPSRLSSSLVVDDTVSSPNLTLSCAATTQTLAVNVDILGLQPHPVNPPTANPI